MEQHNKKIIHAVLEAADRGDVETAISYFAPDYVDHDPGEVRRGEGTAREALGRAFRLFASAFPDTRHTLLDLIAEGDRVVARISAEGTHSGDLPGAPASGKAITNDSIVIYRLENGMIVERWSRERSSIMEQLRASVRPIEVPA